VSASAKRTRLALALGLVALLLAAQALAAAVSPVATPSTANVLGKAGFAYLGGLRTFVAAVLWNRIEPQFHEYYEGQAFTEQVQVLPTMRLVNWLDPQFEQAYFVAAYLVAMRGDIGTGLDVAREGVRNNPTSGLLRSSLIQVLMLQDKKANLPEMVRQADMIVEPTTTWASDEDRFEGLAVARTAYVLAGDNVASGRIIQELKSMRDSGIGRGDHDHDGDGKQDH